MSSAEIFTKSASPRRIFVSPRQRRTHAKYIFYLPLDKEAINFITSNQVVELLNLDFSEYKKVL